MGLRTNINKIHTELKDKFDEVYVKEKYSQEFGNYIELSVNENNRTLKSIIKKVDLVNNQFEWRYYSNPNFENSTLVERTSTTDNFTKDVLDIFEKNRFDSEYK